MGKQKTRNDTVFGTLTHVAGDGWERQISLQFLGKSWTIALMVHIGAQGLEENQLWAYSDFLKRKRTLIRQAERAIIAFCRGKAAQRWSIPAVSSAADLRRLIEPEAITFPYVHARPTLGFLCQCSWDEEHGLAVKFESGKVAGLGSQDIVL